MPSRPSYSDVIYRYAPAKMCIYCGSTEYAAGVSRKLADEHIIPQGMWGPGILPEASCRRCESITGRQEQLFMKGQIHAWRTAFGAPSKKPKDRPSSFPLFVQASGKFEKVMVDIDDYPLSIMLPIYSPPTLMVGGNISTPNEGDIFCFLIDEDKRNILANKYNIYPKSQTDTLGLPSLNMAAFCKMLAKIAHSFAVAEIGLEGWEPLLLDYILDETDQPPLRCHIGGDVRVHPKVEGSFNEIGFTTHPILPDMLVVNIRFFAFLGAPTYLVVVGRKFL